MAAPEHPRLTPEEAARRIKEAGESVLLSEAEIASGLRDHVEEFGPAEVDIAGELYTVETEDAEPYVPDLEGWAEGLADEIRRTPTDFQGHEDVPEDAALALVNALDPEDLARLCDALLETAPGFAERVSGMVLDTLKEDVARETETGGFGGTPVELIEEIQAKWAQEA